MESRAVPRAATVLGVLGGAIWVAAGVLYGAMVATCFSCASAMVPPGVDTSTFSLPAVHIMGWDVLYANAYIVTIGVLAMLIGLTAFRRGETWAWWAVLVFALAGFVTAVLDEIAWGGWFTFLFLGLAPSLGVIVSAKTIWARRR